jgi:uncharacterized protein
MKTINEIRQVLSLQKQSLCEIYQITEIGIFGSYLSQLFGLKVDIVTKNGLKPRIRDRVLALD